eukprot:Rmarinus@m.29370
MFPPFPISPLSPMPPLPPCSPLSPVSPVSPMPPVSSVSPMSVPGMPSCFPASIIQQAQCFPFANPSLNLESGFPMEAQVSQSIPIPQLAPINACQSFAPQRFFTDDTSFPRVPVQGSAPATCGFTQSGPYFYSTQPYVYPMYVSYEEQIYGDTWPHY